MPHSRKVHEIACIWKRGSTMRKIFAALALPLMLSGCWLGPQYYQLAESERPIPPGLYKSSGSYDRFDERNELHETTRARISYQADGHIVLTPQGDHEDPSYVILVPIDKEQGLYAVQVEFGQGVTAINTAVYGLVWVRGDRYRVSLPRCDRPHRVSPRSRVYVGGILSGPITCSYPTREAFEKAALEFAEDPTSWDEYRRIKD
jgi:hypothetical protein